MGRALQDRIDDAARTSSIEGRRLRSTRCYNHQRGNHQLNILNICRLGACLVLLSLAARCREIEKFARTAAAAPLVSAEEELGRVLAALAQERVGA